MECDDLVRGMYSRDVDVNVSVVPSIHGPHTKMFRSACHVRFWDTDEVLGCESEVETVKDTLQTRQEQRKTNS